MAEITPVTREEYYLAKAGGQDVPVPSAVTREEYYLEKLSNDSVVVPTPVTRREKFLYFACGGDVTLPSEEKMTRLERLIAKAGGMDVSTPTAVTRLEKLWANVEGGGWKTITGVLPLTFTAKGGTAVDWVIRGNDENGTENLFDGTTIQKGRIDNGVPGYASDTLEAAFENGVITFATTTSYRGVYFDPIAIDSAFTFTFSRNSGEVAFYFDFYADDMTYISRNSTNQTSSPITITFSTPQNAKFVRLSIRGISASTYIIADIMLVKGSTAPDHYIPYQQGVGERTVNLFDINNVLENYYLNNGVPTQYNNGRYVLSDYIPIESNTATISAKCAKISGLGVHWAVYDENKTFIRGEIAFTATNVDKVITKSVDVSGAAFFRVDYALESFTDCMLNLGSTALPYKPYGYQIPLTVSQQGQPDKTVDIYIGDSPLTEGETVSKTSTGVDIELFEGENTVSTTLTNKPNMSITYKGG